MGKRKRKKRQTIVNKTENKKLSNTNQQKDGVNSGNTWVKAVPAQLVTPVVFLMVSHIRWYIIKEERMKGLWLQQTKHISVNLWQMWLQQTKYFSVNMWQMWLQQTKHISVYMWQTFQNGYRNHDGDCKTLWGHPELCNRYGLIQIFKFVQRKLHWVSTTSSQIHTLIKEAWTYNVQSNLYTKGTRGNLTMCLYVQLYNFNGG